MAAMMMEELKKKVMLSRVEGSGKPQMMTMAGTMVGMMRMRVVVMKQA